MESSNSEKFMSKTNNLEYYFFTLIRSALWGTPPVLSSTPCNDDWKELYDISKEQTVTGIMLDAVSQLPEEQKPETALRLQWIMAQKSIEVQNRKMDNVLACLVSECREQGLEPYLLKGQSMAQNYPIPGHRICGDIDIYFKEDSYAKALDYFDSKGFVLEGEPEDSHIETTYKNFKVEIHRKSATFYTKRLQRRYNAIMQQLIGQENTNVTINDKDITVLPPLANALQLLSHMLRHMIFSGLGLRQVCDWALFAYKYQKSMDKELFVKYTKELQLWETYKAVTAIATDYLGLPKEYAVCEITEKDKKLAKKVFQLIMTYGNFGHYGEHSITESKSEYLKAYLWKVKNCIRFRKLSPSETWNYPLWQLHSAFGIMKKK